MRVFGTKQAVRFRRSAELRDASPGRAGYWGGALLVPAIAPPSPVSSPYYVHSAMYVPLPPSTPFGPGGRVCRCRTSGGASEKSGRQVNNNNNTNLPCGLTSKSSRCSKQQQPPPETGTEKKAGQFWTAAAHGSLWSSSHRVTLQAPGLDVRPACPGRAGRWDALPSLEPPCPACARGGRNEGTLPWRRAAVT